MEIESDIAPDSTRHRAISLAESEESGTGLQGDCAAVSNQDRDTAHGSANSGGADDGADDFRASESDSSSTVASAKKKRRRSAARVALCASTSRYAVGEWLLSSVLTTFISEENGAQDGHEACWGERRLVHLLVRWCCHIGEVYGDEALSGTATQFHSP